MLPFLFKLNREESSNVSTIYSFVRGSRVYMLNKMHIWK